MNDYDVIIIGGGPGGYAAAVKARKSGLKTALIEKELVGGTCVNWGCIPTKALLRYAKLKPSLSNLEYTEARDKSFKITKERREKLEGLLEDCRVMLFIGAARLLSGNEVEIQPSGARLTGNNIIVATGSSPRRIPGVEYDGADIVTVREALRFDEAPASAVIVGSGATGMELATVWNYFGTKVTVLEILPGIMGIDDSEISKTAAEHFRNSGMQIRTGVKVESVMKTAVGVEVTFGDGKTQEKLIAEKALVAAGITPNNDNLGLEELNVEMELGYIKIDNQMRTNIPSIYAVGDVTGKLALAFVASEQGVIAADSIAGRESKELIYENIPRCIYSGIEVATVGLTEKQAWERGFDVVTYSEPFAPRGKAIALGESSGFIKLIADAKSDKAFGAVMIGGDAAERISAPARLISLGVTAQAIIGVVCKGR